MTAATRALPDHGTTALRRDMTDAEPVRQHLRTIMAAGVTRRQAADLAGLSRDTVSRILYRGHHVHTATARKILAVTPEAGRPIDATGTRRMLKALGCDGYGPARIGVALGVAPAAVRRWLRYSTISAAHADAVTHLYARWAGIPAETNGSTPDDAEQVRTIARRRRWAPAAAWDGNINDPHAAPCPHRTVLCAAELLDESEHLLSLGESIDAVAKQLGTTVPALERARLRAKARERAAASAATAP